MENTTNSSVHPMHKSYTLVSSKHVDLENLSAFEAVTMSLALVMAVSAAVISQVASVVA